ncbi:MAG: histidinol-phosphate transaminase [Deltaproteobacteria bacterium]|nr:histidinol-phosphate transaminase [Deltaproteobacteria bacterium]
MFSERLKRLTPYVPGEQPRDRRYLKLNTNENPYPPSPEIKKFLAGFDPERLRLYPDPLSLNLRSRIASTCGLTEDRVFVGNGSDETLSFAFYAFFDPGRGPLLFPQFTYSFYPVYCDFYGIPYEKVPLRSDFSVDVSGFLSRADSCGVIFANPNAPTGICLPLEEVRHFLEGYPDDRVVVVDEAYIDFGGESALALLDRFPNLLLMRTFSKSMSLAGLRVGYALGSRDLIGALFTVKDSFNSYPLDALSQVIAEIALSDEAYYRSVTDKIRTTRDAFSRDLEGRGWRVLPSKANFVFAAKPGIAGTRIYGRLREQGVLVRHFDLEGIRDFVRITIGTKEDMERFLEEIDALQAP